MMERLLQGIAGALVWLGRLVVWFYYSPVKVAGRGNLPRGGPVLLVANHANSLMDPVLVGLAARRRVSFLAKAPLFEVPVFGGLLRWLGMIPVFRPRDDAKQTKRSLVSLTKAAEALARGEWVGIFPEGKTHDQRALAEVMGGAARLAQQAVEAGAKGLRVVPVGINFDDKRLFRSAVWIEVGEPVAVEEILAAGGSAAGGRKELTREIADRLRQVIIHLDRAEFEPVLEDLEVLDPAMTRPGKEKVFSLRQRKIVAAALNHFCATDPAKVASVGRRLVAHRARLRERGLGVGSAVLNEPCATRWRRLLWNSFRLLFGLVPVAAGLVQNLPPWLLAGLVTRLVPQAGFTTVALSRLGAGLPLFGLWYAFTWWLLVGYFLPWVAWFWVLVTPFAGLFALRYLRSARMILRDWACELRMLWHRDELAALRQNQESLRQKIRALSHAYAALRPPLPEKSPRWHQRPTVRFALLTGATLVAVFGFSYCALRVGFTGRSLDALVLPAPDYRDMPVAEIDARLDRDEARLRGVITAFDQLAARAANLRAGFDSGRYSFYSDADNDLISREMLTYLGLRQELLDLILSYRSYATIPDARARARADLLQLAAGGLLYQHARQLAGVFDHSPRAARRLNEGEPAWGIPAGMLDMVRDNLANEHNIQPLRTALASYRERAGGYEKAGWLADEPRASFHRLVMALVISPPADMRHLARFARAANELRDGLIYRGQSAVSRAVGATRVRERKEGPRVRPAQIADLRTRLRPGDIILERQDWYLSRAFMPGYWAHAALYVGTPDEIKAMGLAEHPWVRPHWDAFRRAGEGGGVHAIIEAVPEGVRFTTLEKCAGVADSVAALRPARLGENDLREAVARAFHHLGKEYDFEFDFFSADKLVCTELVSRAFDDRLAFKLVSVMGRETLPPTELARQFAAGRHRPDRDLELVMFLDGHARGEAAVERGADDFAATVDRPGMTWFSSLD